MYMYNFMQIIFIVNISSFIHNLSLSTPHPKPGLTVFEMVLHVTPPPLENWPKLYRDHEPAPTIPCYTRPPPRNPETASRSFCLRQKLLGGRFWISQGGLITFLGGYGYP